MKMKAIICLMIVVITCIESAAQNTPMFVDATASESFKVYWLIKTDKAPKIDGVLDEKIWTKAKPLKDWGICNYGRQKGKLGDIDFRACWDETYLYVGAKMYHRRKPEDMDEFRKEVTNVTAPIYSRECLEIHIDGNLDHATRFQAITNVLGEKMMIWFYDFGWGILTNNDYGLDADWDVAGKINKDHWTLEARIALADIQVKPRIGTMFGLNPCWFNWADSRENAGYWWQFMTWSTHGDSHHDPRLYGRFIMVKDRPADLKTGLELAFPDLDKQQLMIQVSDGFIRFDKGKMTRVTELEKVKKVLDRALAKHREISAMAKNSKMSRYRAYVEKSISENEKTLKEIEAVFASGKPIPGRQLSEYDKTLKELTGNMENLYWRAKQDVLLTNLEDDKTQ